MVSKGYVLIAEPDARLLYVLSRIVTFHGLEPVATRDGAFALATMVERGAPTILITNLTLPRLDGFALLAELRRIAGPNPSTAVVISPSLEMRAKAYDLRASLGISEIVSSTMEVTSLTSAIRRALEAVAAAPLSSAPPLSSASPLSFASPFSERTTAALARHRDPLRLSRIAKLGLVHDGPPEESLQRLVEETARTFNVPIALLSIVLGDQQWFKAHVGLGGELLENRGTPISQSFCRHVVDSECNAPLIVPDATRHPIFADNPLVLSGAIGSYAGAPLLTTGGDVLGTLCIIDTQPLGIDQEQIDILVALARRVAGEIELQSKARAAVELTEELSRKLATERSRTRAISAMVSSYGAVLAHLEIGILLMDEDRKVLYVNPALAKMVGLRQADLFALSGQDIRRHIASLRDDPEDLHGELQPLYDGPFVATSDISLSRPVWRVLRWESKPVDLPAGVAQLELYTDITDRADTEFARIKTN